MNSSSIELHNEQDNTSIFVSYLTLVKPSGEYYMTVALKDLEYLDEGGEGTLYKRNNLVFKLFTSINQEKIDKIQALLSRDLSTIANFVTTPLYQIQNIGNGKVIGYAMNYVDLSQYAKITEAVVLGEIECIKVFQSFVHLVNQLHKAGFIVGDFNPANLLYHKQTKQLLLIDIDGFGFGKYAVSMRGKCDVIDKQQHQKVTIQNDYYHIYCLLVDIIFGINPHDTRHPVYGRDVLKLQQLGISIFHSEVEALLKTRVKNIMDSLPAVVLEDLRSVFVHHARYPVRLETLKALLGFYGQTPVTVVNNQTKLKVAKVTTVTPVASKVQKVAPPVIKKPMQTTPQVKKVVHTTTNKPANAFLRNAPILRAPAFN